MKYDVGIIGTGGAIIDSVISSLNVSGLKIAGFGRKQPENSGRLAQFIAFDIEKPQRLAQPTEVKTLIFNAGVKGRFAEGTPEFKAQGIVSAPDFRVLLPLLNLNCDRLITMGSSEEYGPKDSPVEIFEYSKVNPISSYGKWKFALFESAQAWKKQSGKPVLHIRPFNVIGPGMDSQMFVSSLILGLLRGESFKMTKGEQWRSFVSKKLLSRCFNELIKLKSWTEFNRGDVFNLSSANYLKLVDVVRLVQELIPNSQIKVGALEYRNDEVWHQNPNLDLMKRLMLNEFFEDIQITLKDTIAFNRKF